MRPIPFLLTSVLLAGVLTAALLLAPSPALAWGRDAHRVIADLAQARLDPTARTEVARLLALEPASSLADVSTWADEQRRDSLADEAGSPADRRTHYVNFHGGCNYVPARDCPDGRCVIAAINRQFLALSDARRPDAERLVALKMLVHLVADVHQPLHASSMDDKGGNDFQLSYAGKGRNLHSTWDTLLLDHAMATDRRDEPAFVAGLQSRPALPADPTTRSDRPAVDWALEGCRLVRDGGLYPAGHVIGDDYLDAHRAQLELRLRRAGERLADMINHALDPSSRRSTP